jgi:hypothetical protein
MVRTDKWRRLRRAWPLAILAALLVLLGLQAVGAQNPNQHEAKPKLNVEDKVLGVDDFNKPDGKIWVLDFKFYAPRQITVDVPGRGRKLCWYMKYQVINNTKAPRTFIPDFEWVSNDAIKPAKYHDQVLPKVEEAILKVEDPLGNLEFKNSVTIAAKPIPPTKPDSIPHAINGLAIWDDIDPVPTQFSIYVSGLSNGWSLAEIPPDNKQIVRRKTLKLNFRRLGDRYLLHAGEVRFVEPEEWVYRSTDVTLPPAKAAKPAEAPAKAAP